MTRFCFYVDVIQTKRCYIVDADSAQEVSDDVLTWATEDLDVCISSIDELSPDELESDLDVYISSIGELSPDELESELESGLEDE